MSPPPGRVAAASLVLLLLATAQVVVALLWLPHGTWQPQAWDVWLTGGFYLIPEPDPSLWLLPPLLCGAGMVRAGASGRLGWTLALGGAMHVGLIVAGPLRMGELFAPLVRPEEYLAEFPRFLQEGPIAWLGAYVPRLEAHDLPLHATAHPPGATLFMIGMLLLTAHPVRMALLLVAVGLLGAWGVQRLARHFMPERQAVLAAMLWLAMPSVALLTGTNADLPRAVAAVAVALAWLRAARSGRLTSWFLAGAVHGAALLLSFSLLTLAPVLVALVWPWLTGRRWILAGVAGAATVFLLLWLATGFDVVACAWAARTNIAAKVQGMGRPAWLVLLNLPVFAASSGFALSGLLLAGGSPPAWTRRMLWGVLAGLALTSPLVRGEVERVWLPFTPFLALAAAGSLEGEPGLRLARAVGLALVVQAVAVEGLFGTFW